jgi:hypothetical protein
MQQVKAAQKKREGNIQPSYGIQSSQKSKNFEYILDDSCDSLYRRQPGEKSISTTSSSTSLTAARYARGLAVAHSRKLSATLGGSTSTRPGVSKIILKTCDFINISNTAIPTVLGGLDNNFASDRGCDSTTTTRLRHRRLRPRRPRRTDKS